MPRQIGFIRPSFQQFAKSHKKEILSTLWDCISNGRFILQRDVEEFEKNLAEFVGTKYAVGTNSGTDALYFALRACGIKSGDEVITVSHTFLASISEIVRCGATPILVDVNTDGLMDIPSFEKAITEKTKAVMPVHLSGKVCDMKAILQIAETHHLQVIEDAAQALGATCNTFIDKTKRVGSFGNAGCFSFYPAKILGCFGDAGAVTTNNPEIYRKIKLLRNHYDIPQTGLLSDTPEEMEWTGNSRLDNIQAAILNLKLKYLQQSLDRRKEIAQMYNEGLRSLGEQGFFLPIQYEGQVYQEYIVNVLDREALAEYLRNNGVEVLIRDTIPNHKRKGLELDHFQLPITERLAEVSMRLPIYPELRNSEVKRIIRLIKRFYAAQHAK